MKLESIATWMLSLVAVTLAGMIACRLVMVYGNPEIVTHPAGRPPVALR